MPRVEDRLHPVLRACLERENPRVHFHVEVSAPDVGLVLRRAEDQFLLDAGDGGPRVSESPVGSTVASATGALTLAASALTIASFTGTSEAPGLFNRDLSRTIEGLRWSVARGFRGTLRRFRARVRREPYGPLFIKVPHSHFQLQIYRPSSRRGVRRRADGTIAGTFTEWTFVPLLASPPVISEADQIWVPLGDAGERSYCDLDFSLENAGLVVDGTPTPGADAALDDPAVLYFVITPLTQQVGGLKHFAWYTGGLESGAVSGVGDFESARWERASEDVEWAETRFGKVHYAAVDIDEYDPAGGQAVYHLALGRAPAAGTSGSTGRIVFERATPEGSSATCEIATAGASGPWTAVTHGDVVATAQDEYWIRATLAPNAAHRAAPSMFAIGVEFRTPVDVSRESKVAPLGMGLALPTLKPEIGEGTLEVLRTGRRDYEDQATALGSTAPATRLEVDTYLASDHPLATRDTWLLLDRALVSNRVPTPTAERFTLLSYASRLKRKLPQKVETLSTVHTVAAAASDGTTVDVSTATPLESAGTAGNDYDNAGYYLRVRRSSEDDVATGFQQVIAGSEHIAGDPAGVTRRLVFDPPLPGVLAVGDEIEVHSGIVQAPVLTWTDADPADVRYEILTVHLGIPPERLGQAGIGRFGGMPPRVTDIAPGDPVTQAKRRVTMRLTSQEEGTALLAQLDEFLGGATIDIAGQLCFVQILPLRDGAGQITVSPGPVVAVFDPRDVINPQTPPGLEHRATVVSCKYGVNQAAADPEQYPESTTSWADVDAVAWLDQQDLDAFGVSEIDDKVARWCFNAGDGGLSGASELAWRRVYVGSTGLRVWSWGLRDMHPELVPGDGVALITDQYTDYDPFSQAPLKGWLAVRGVVVGVSGDRRSVRVLVPGLYAGIVQLRGGQAGTIAGVGIDPPNDFALSVFQSGTAEFSSVFVNCNGTTPVHPFLDRLETLVRSRKSGAVDWSPWAAGPTARALPIRLPASWSTDYEVQLVTVAKYGVTRVSPILAIAVGANPAAEITLGTPAASASSVTVPYTMDEDASYTEVWEQQYADGAQPGAPGAVPVSVENVGTKVDTLRQGDGRTSITRTPAAGTPWVGLTFVPFSALNQRGVPQHTLTKIDAGAAAPNPPSAVANVSKTATTTTNRLTMPATSVPAKLRVYRNGVQYGTDITVTAGAGATQDVVHSGLDPSTAYEWKYKGVSSGGVPSATYSPAVTVTTDPGTIPTPSLSATRRSQLIKPDPTAPGTWYTAYTVDFEITPGAGSPSGVTWQIEAAESSSAGPYSFRTGTTSTTASYDDGTNADADWWRVYGTKAGWTTSARSSAVQE